MKKLFALILCLCMLCGCTAPKNSSYIPVEKDREKKDISLGVWLSYYEIEELLTPKESFKDNFAGVLENLQNIRATDLYIHIRSHCDSLYKSEYFPQIPEAQNLDFDPFEYMLNQCHSKGIRVHAWFNPYRVSSAETNLENLSKDSPAYKWLFDDNEENDKNVIVYNGIYLNPAEFEVRQLVLKGIEEVIENYSVDGIHFDDYFYPTTDPEFDKKSFKVYKKTAKEPLSLENWRRANVDALIVDCKILTENSKEKIVFSVSPAADIEKNYNSFYADISGWVKNGYVDEIIPQLYFGFNHTDRRFNFDNLLEKWQQLSSQNHSVKLKIGLAPYKIGTNSDSDGMEWQENKDILSRQVKLCRESEETQGVILFSYSSFFSDEEINTEERNNFIKAYSE